MLQNCVFCLFSVLPIFLFVPTKGMFLWPVKKRRVAGRGTNSHVELDNEHAFQLNSKINTYSTYKNGGGEVGWKESGMQVDSSNPHNFIDCVS